MQVVRCEGQSNDMCYQVAHPSPRVEGRVARAPQESRLVSDNFKRTSHTHYSHASRRSQPRRFPQGWHSASQGTCRCGTRKSSTDTLYASLVATPKSWYSSITLAQEGADSHYPTEDSGGCGDTRPCGRCSRPKEEESRYGYEIQLTYGS
jgi:hypothetical protein